jgi:hypothetical protein
MTRQLRQCRREGAFQFSIRLVCAGEVGVADEEALAVVFSVNEPAGDVVRATVANLAGAGVVDPPRV